MALVHYACTHCGGWSLWFDHERPPACQVCLDPRNALPKDGFRFLTEVEARNGRRTELSTVAPGLRVARECPALGLGSAGWIVDTADGTVAIEGAGHYSADALEEIGELIAIAASHPHGYGAIWQLQEATGAHVSVHRADIPHTKGFRVTRPLDDEGELAPSIRYRRLGGHYEGQCAFFDEEAARVFVGDAVKVEYDEDGRPEALSAHKGFHYEIPLTPSEIERYRQVLGSYAFRHLATTFDHADRLGREKMLAFYDYLLVSPPTTQPVRIDQL